MSLADPGRQALEDFLEGASDEWDIRRRTAGGPPSSSPGRPVTATPEGRSATSPIAMSDESTVAPPDRRSSPSSAHLEVGAGRPLVTLQGFGTLPRTYRSTDLLLGRRCRVVVPAIFGNRGTRWRPESVRDDLRRLLDELGTEWATYVAHPLGGGLLLELAAACPERVADLVFIDTLGASREWTLAGEVVRHPLRLLWMATPTRPGLRHCGAGRPLHIVQAAWWGFVSDRRLDMRRGREAGIDTHVLWAPRDSLLARDDGRAFAEGLAASFTVVRSPSGTSIDHDWLDRHPWSLVDQVNRSSSGRSGAELRTDVIPGSRRIAGASASSIAATRSSSSMTSSASMFSGPARDGWRR